MIVRTKIVGMLACAVGIAWLGLPTHAERSVNAAEPPRPNIVFLLADDLGWGDPSCYGNRRFRTPNLDRLAKEGVLFTHYYQNGSVCSPARCSLMTSRYPAEMRIHGHLASHEQNVRRDMPDLLDPSVPTLPKLLRQAGYKTIHVGKWHLGRPSGSTGLEAYGFEIARWIDVREGDRNLWSVAERPHASKELVDAATAELEQVGDEPFFLQVWFNDPHAPLAPSPEQMARFRRNEPEGFTSPYMVYAATVTEMDRQIGRLLDKLDELKLTDNTLVIFSSDNGPEDIDIGNATWSAYGSPGPLRGRKRSLYEGGIRVPFIVRWPKATPAGRVNDHSIVSGVDLLPTLCELAGAEIPDDLRAVMHGESFAAALRGDESYQRSSPLMWEWRFRVFNHPWNRCPMLAIREGNWKLLMNPDRSRVELYDVVADPGEYQNEAEDHPEIVERLAAEVLAWQKTLPPGMIEEAAGKNDYPWPSDD